MGDSELVLYNSWASPFGARVRIALAEKGIDKYELEEVDLFNKSPMLTILNPVHNKIPVLVHNGMPICESLNIVQYIDEVWKGEFPILPSDPYRRSVARFWADFIDKTIYDNMKKITRTKGEDQEKAKRELIHIFKLLEGELGEKPFFGGNYFGYVDIALITFYGRFYALEIIGKFSIEEECPKLVAWAKRCLQRKSVSEFLPDPKKSYEFILFVNEKLGFI